MIRLSLTLATTLCLSTLASHGQFASSLKLSKRQHLVGESVMVTLTLTNHSGQEQHFHNNGRFPWLSFIVKTSNGRPVNTRRNIDFGPMRIAPGQSLARTIDLSRHFLLQQPGNFSASAVIHAPDPDLDGTSTNRVFFEQRNGRTYWTQKVGGIGPDKEMRVFRLIQFRGDSKTQLYCQVENGSTGQLIRTMRLGNTLLTRQPVASIDRDQRMHVMFLSTPVMWIHYIVDAEGNIDTRQIHKRAAVGDPKMVSLRDGSVEIINSIPYDPEEAATKRANIRKITDRPDLIGQF